MIETLIVILNMVWLYLCLAPVLLILAIILIRRARNSSIPVQSNKQSHKHKYQLDSSRSLVKAIPGTPDHGVKRTYVCDCGDEYEDKFIG